MKKTSVLIIIAMLFVTVAIFGRDGNKDERASLLNQITAIEADLSRLNGQHAGVSNAVEALSSEVKQYSDDLQQHIQRRTKLQDELGAYILDHKMATVAILAAGGGAASILSDNIDEDTKNMLIALAILGGLYCLGNIEECADVTARIMYYGSQIESENKKISDGTSKFSAKKAALQERENEQASLGDVINKKVRERDTLKQEHDSLLCRFCY